MAFTNRGLYRMLEILMQGATPPTSFYVALVTDTPTIAINTFSELTEIGAGNGYTSGGKQVARSVVGFDVVTEDDTNQQAYAQAADIAWTASGGPIPASGNDATYAVLLDDNATVANREVWAYGAVAQGMVTSGAILTLADFEFILGQP